MTRIERRERMAGLLRRWQRSGETAVAFCRRHGIKRQRLSYWKGRLGVADAALAPAARQDGGGLVPVRLVPSGGSAAALEIELASGDRLVVHEGSSLELLRRVVAVLRERC